MASAASLILTMLTKNKDSFMTKAGDDKSHGGGNGP